MSRKNRQTTIIVIAFATIVMLGAAALMLTSPATVRAPSAAPNVAIVTPTGARPACGNVAKADGSGGFPVINLSSCPPDPSKLVRKVWKTVAPRLTLSGAAVDNCQDWYAYHTNQTGNWEIFRWNAADSAINLSKGGPDTNNIGPALSPDREAVAFTSDRDGNWEIYVANASGADEPQRITYNTFAVDMAPIWSPDGKFIVYESIRRGNWDIYMFDMAAGDERQLTDAAGNDVLPIWSNDSKRVLYQSFRDGIAQLWEVAIDGDMAQARRISDGKGADTDPIYSPGGNRIAFLSVRAGSKSPIVYLSGADGSAPTPISDPAIAAANQSFSPNGNLITYQATRDGVSSIYLYDVTTKRTRQVTDRTTASYAPTWNCQSSELVFTANMGKNPGLFSAPALPMEAPSISVGEDAKRLTPETSAAQFAVGASRFEKASKQNLGSPTSAMTDGQGG